MRMKKRKRIAKRGKIARLQASAGQPNFPLEEYYRPIKKPVTLRLDADVLAWFRKQGRGYQTRINQALRKVMTAERKKAGA
jgi:uncharacterized protein (DUF4415 family)